MSLQLELFPSLKFKTLKNEMHTFYLNQKLYHDGGISVNLKKRIYMEKVKLQLVNIVSCNMVLFKIHFIFS